MARSPPLSLSPSPSGDNQPGDVRKTAPTASGTGVAAVETAAESSPESVSRDDNNVLGGTAGDARETGDEPLPVLPSTEGVEDSSAPPDAASLASFLAESSSRDVDEPSLGGGAASGGVDFGDGGSRAANLALNGGATFVLVAKEHLVGTWLAVFVRASMLQEVSDVRTGT